MNLDTLKPMKTSKLTLKPIGQIRVKCEQNRYWAELEPQYRPGLNGLEAFSHALLLWWSGGDMPEGDPGHVVSHPPYPQAGAQGTFATRSPRRPNPIAVTIVRIKKVDARTGIVEITSVDARNGSWLLDIKPYIPANERVLNAKTADWMASFPDHWEEPRPAKMAPAADAGA